MKEIKSIQQVRLEAFYTSIPVVFDILLLSKKDLDAYNRFQDLWAAATSAIGNLPSAELEDEFNDSIRRLEPEGAAVSDAIADAQEFSRFAHLN